jgi:EmrB/QacA subfamily drug resistance transporter
MTEPRERATRRAALVAATLSSFLTPFMGSATNLAMPSIGAELGLDAVQLGWVPTAYLLAAAMFLVPFGRLADIHGRKRVFVSGVIVYTIASLLCGLSPSGRFLISSRALQGTGGSMFFATSVAILTSVFPASERGRVLGLNVAAVYSGLSLGPFIGGLLTQYVGWRSIFLVNVPLGLVVVAFVALRLEGEWAESKGEGFDLAGSIVYALTLLALMYGFSRLPEALGAGLIVLGLGGFVAFGWWETRVAYPVLNLELFHRNRAFAFSCLAALINYGATSAVSFLLSLYLQYIKALSPQQAGLVLIAQPVFQASCSPLAGRLSDRIEPRIVASVGMALTAIGLSLLVLVTFETPLWAIIGILVVLGIGFALFSSPNMNAIMSSVAKRYYGVASGTAATMRLLGQMASMGIATLLFALFIGRVEITEAVYPQFMASMKAALTIFSALCLGGIGISLTRGSVRVKHE